MNYEEKCRSNYFTVKDPDAFDQWIKRFPSIRTEKDGLYGICLLIDEGGWPDTCFVEDHEIDLDFKGELQDHLSDDCVVVLMSTGHEGMRYLFGHAIAFDNTGKTVQITLDDIYSMARETFGADAVVTEAAY